VLVFGIRKYIVLVNIKYVPRFRVISHSYLINRMIVGRLKVTGSVPVGKTMAVVVVRRWDDNHTVLGSEKSGRRDRKKKEERRDAKVLSLT
jgi:hypothetical protein